MPKYDGKEIGYTEGFMVRENMSAYQYHQALQKVQSGELLRLRPGVFAEPATLADTILDIDVLVPGGVLCMYSAWEHYELTTQIPSAFCIAIPRKRKLVLPECAEILKTYLHRTDRNIAKLIEYAKKLRVAATLKTYLEIEL